MKTILIIGDSWGVPNYYGPPGDIPEIHTEFLLKELGYKVYNCSLNGNGNINSLRLAQRYLLGESCVLEPVKKSKPNIIEDTNIKIDWVLWFHTEVLRDMAHVPKWENYIEQMIIDCSNYVYKEVAEFINTLNCKIAVIGGQVPVVHTLYNYIQPNFIIEDWRSIILDEKMPDAHNVSSTKHLETSKDSIDFKLDYIKKIDYIRYKMRNSIDFPDQAHPGKRPHKELVSELDKIFRVK